VHPDSRVIIKKSRKHQQEQKPDVPTSVKKIAGYQQQDILMAEFFEDEPV
jgi:hypothetical protein